MVIKSHSLHPSTSELCCTGGVKAIYTWRHPYDAIASAMRFAGLSADHWISVLRNALRIWSFHQATGSACIVSYEAMMREPSAGIERIAAYLGLQLHPEQLRQIAYQVSLEQMKNLSQHIDGLEPSRLVRKNGIVYDRQTLLHKNHILDGGVGYGVRILNYQQLLAIDSMLQEERFEFLCQPHDGTYAVSHASVESDAPGAC